MKNERGKDKMKISEHNFKELVYCYYCEEVTPHNCVRKVDSKLEIQCTKCLSKTKEI